jgi:hypothetical protein
MELETACVTAISCVVADTMRPGNLSVKSIIYL